jgi:hypothetical protein
MKNTMIALLSAICLTSCAKQSAQTPPNVSVLTFEPNRLVEIRLMASPEHPLQYELAWDGSETRSVDHPVVIRAETTGPSFRVTQTHAETGETEYSSYNSNDVVKDRGAKALLDFMQGRSEGATTIWLQHSFPNKQGRTILRLTVFQETESHNQ